MFGRFSFLACKVCRAFMRGSHNLFVNVKVTKIVGGPICFIVANNVFGNLSK